MRGKRSSSSSSTRTNNNLLGPYIFRFKITQDIYFIPITILFIVLLGAVSFIGEISYAQVFNLGVRGAGGRFFIVDHDSRKSVAKNFRHFFSPKISYFYFSRAPRSRAQKFFFKVFLKNSSKIPPGDAAAAASNQQQREIIQVPVYMNTQNFARYVG
jgi:hypothetical protein